MSPQDEISIVVKCLRLGAADYLVKPLRTNELLNLWTHMWRMRRKLGLTERGILNYDFDLVASEPSDANTSSTTLFSDDTVDKSRKCTNLEIKVPIHQEDGGNLHVVQRRVATPNDENVAQHNIIEENLMQSGKQLVNDTQVHENGEAWENCSHSDDFPSSSSVPDSLSLERSSVHVSMEFSQQKNFTEDKFPQVLAPPRNEPGLPTQSAYSYYVSGGLNQVMMMPSSALLFHNSLHDLQNHASFGALPQYNHLQHCFSHPHASGMASFPYYPVNMCMQPGPMPTGHSWPAFKNSSTGEVKSSKVDRREATLMKFRKKRKERCFDKKIRYVNRKRLAERRPRVRGQFVRKLNGVIVDLNGQPACPDYDEQVTRDSSPEDYIS